MSKHCICLSALLALLGPAAQASIVLSDDFSYPNGALVSVSNGRWKTHSGTAGQVQVSSGQIELTQRKSEDVSAEFPGAMGPLDALELYASFKCTFTSLPTGTHGTYFAHFKDTTATTGLRCRIFATTNGAAPGALRVGVAAATNYATATLARDLELGTAYHLVCRLLLTDNTSTLWLNPGAETDPAATATDPATPKTAAAFAFRQSLASGAGMGELTVDDLIVATTFAEVRPALPPPPILRLRIEYSPGSNVRLHWPAQPGQFYSVWATEDPCLEYYLLATGLEFSNGSAEFEEPLVGVPARFYRVSNP